MMLTAKTCGYRQVRFKVPHFQCGICRGFESLYPLQAVNGYKILGKGLKTRKTWALTAALSPPKTGFERGRKLHELLDARTTPDIH